MVNTYQNQSMVTFCNCKVQHPTPGKSHCITAVHFEEKIKPCIELLTKCIDFGLNQLNDLPKVNLFMSAQSVKC